MTLGLIHCTLSTLHCSSSSNNKDAQTRKKLRTLSWWFGFGQNLQHYIHLNLITGGAGSGTFRSYLPGAGCLGLLTTSW